jgi:Domain of unknown function (DUF5658)
MHAISRRTSPLLIAALVLLGSAAVRTQTAQEIVAARVSPEGLVAPAVDVAPPQPQAPTVEPATRTSIDDSRARSSSGLFASLYIGFAATQVLDVHSTLRALDAGHTEANPMMKWATSRPAAFVALKTATTTGTLLVAERIRRDHPKRAMFLMAAIDTAFAFVVAKNYNVPVPPR